MARPVPATYPRGLGCPGIKPKHPVRAAAPASTACCEPYVRSRDPGPAAPQGGAKLRGDVELGEDDMSDDEGEDEDGSDDGAWGPFISPCLFASIAAPMRTHKTRVPSLQNVRV